MVGALAGVLTTGCWLQDSECLNEETTGLSQDADIGARPIQSLYAEVEGEHLLTLHWTEPARDARIRIRIKRAEGEVTGFTECNGAYYGAELPARMTVTSDDGLLDESFVARVGISTYGLIGYDSASLTLDLSAADAETLCPRGSTTPLTLSLQFDPQLPVTPTGGWITCGAIASTAMPLSAGYVE